MWKLIQKRLNSPDALLSMILGLAVILVIGITVVNAVKSITGQQKMKQEEQKKKQEQQIAKLPISHTVKQDETLWSISEAYYKTGYNWVDISAENKLENPDYIVVDEKLTIPDVKPRLDQEGVVTEQAAAVVKPKHTSYTVVEGDTLWDISIKEYELGEKWTDVASANKVINPDLIYPGTILQLP